MSKSAPVTIALDRKTHYSALMSDQNLDRKVRTVVILVTIGTIAWLIAGLIAVVIGTDTKIIWTCIFGAALGATGVRYSIRRAKRSGI